MKKDAKVSVIISVYNGQKFIDKCFDCLLKQSYKNIEIIISDDGSTDSSPTIIKKYAQKYDFIKYDIHKNVGPSESRNIAFKNATGEYVTYLDVDDYLDYYFIEKMLVECDNNDILIAGYRRIYEDGKLDFNYSLSDTLWNRYRRGTVWAKLYKMSFLKKNKIEFPHDRLYGEDIVYTMKCMSKTDNVKIIKYIGYNNLINENSITHKNKDKILNDVPKMINYIDEFIENDNDYLINNKKIVKYYLLKIFVAYLIEQSYFLNYDELLGYYNVSFKKIKSNFKKYNYKLTLCWEKDEPLKVNVMMNVFIIFEKLHLVKFLFKVLNKVYYKEINKE